MPHISDPVAFIYVDTSHRVVRFMDRPRDFKTEYILTQSVPYECADEGRKGTHASKGILHTGRVVWLRSDSTESNSQQQVLVYVDGIGLVSLEQRFIKRIE